MILWPWCGVKQIKIWNKDHRTLTPLTKKEITLRMGEYASGIFIWNFSSRRAAPLHFSSLRRSACTNSHTAAFTVTEKVKKHLLPPAIFIYIIQAAFFLFTSAVRFTSVYPSVIVFTTLMATSPSARTGRNRNQPHCARYTFHIFCVSCSAAASARSKLFLFCNMAGWHRERNKAAAAARRGPQRLFFCTKIAPDQTDVKRRDGVFLLWQRARASLWCKRASQSVSRRRLVFMN